MRTMIVCSLLVLGLGALPAVAGPAMSSSQKTGDISFGDCSSRTAKALEVNGLSVERLAHRVWLGERREHTAMVICYELNPSRTIVTVTAAASSVKEAKSVVDRLEAVIWGTASGSPCGDLAGAWFGDFRGGGPTSIEQRGDTVVLTNEAGSRVTGTCSGGVIHAPDWGNLYGDIRDNGTTIAWRNGTVWRRAAPVDRPQQPSFVGTWQRGGGSPRIEGRGSDLTCINEQGSSSRCVLIAADRIKALDWAGGLIGVLTADGKRIDWANGTSWTR